MYVVGPYSLHYKRVPGIYHKDLLVWRASHSTVWEEPIQVCQKDLSGSDMLGLVHYQIFGEIKTNYLWRKNQMTKFSRFPQQE